MDASRDIDQFVVCSVLPDNRARVDAVIDPMRTFARFRRTRKQPFLPVAALRASAEQFKWATSWDVPSVHPLSLGAFLFRRAGIPDEVRRAVIHHYEVMPADAKSELFHSWRLAVADTDL